MAFRLRPRKFVDLQASDFVKLSITTDADQGEGLNSIFQLEP